MTERHYQRSEESSQLPATPVFRRLKRYLAAVGMTVLFVMPLITAAHADDGKLYLYIWDTYADKELFNKFEKETGIQVVTDIYSSMETLLAKLQSGAAYDIVAPTGNYVPLLASENLLLPLPDELRPLGAKMSDAVKNPGYDVDYQYVLPLFWGTTSVAVNTKLTKENVTSWRQFFERPEGEGQTLGVLDDISTVMNIVSIAAGKSFCDPTPDTLKAIQAMLIKQKPFVKVYGADGYSERLASNEVTMQMAWSGDVYRARKDNPALKYVYPKEGVEVWVDNLAIPAASRNVEAAAKFIAFVMRPENMAEYAQYAGMVPSIEAAKPLLPASFRNAPEFNIPGGIKGPLSTNCPPRVVKNYNKIWQRLLR
jgi:spermidine/putrescine transport system substrate-binding protein